jgi:hypothetical protein
MDTLPEYMTRAQLAEYLRNQHGIPTSLSSLNKLAQPSVGLGPPVAKWWGSRPLYRPAAGLAWALSLMRDGDDGKSSVTA